MKLHDPQHPEYVITHDLGQRLQALSSAGLVVPAADDPMIVAAQRQLVEDMSEAIPDGNKVVTIQMEDLAREVVAAVRERWPDALIVSACPEISTPECVHLEVSRLYGLRGEFVGVGPRPGYPSLLEQVEEFRDASRDRGIVIVEDGVFSGATAEHIVNRMKAKGITPLGFVAGFTFDRGRNVLDAIQRGRTEVVLAHELDNPVAWHPDHDFFPFIPGSGRVVGFTLDGRYRTNRFPLYTYNGATYAFPYLPQFSNSARLWADWSGLPDSAAEVFGNNCLNSVIELYKTIERLNNRQIVIGDVISSSTRTSIHLKVGESDFPPLDTRIVDYLQELA